MVLFIRVSHAVVGFSLVSAAKTRFASNKPILTGSVFKCFANNCITANYLFNLRSNNDREGRGKVLEKGGRGEVDVADDINFSKRNAHRVYAPELATAAVHSKCI